MKDWLPLLGVVVAQFVLVGLYFLKQRGDDRRRWHDKRMDVYSALALAFRDSLGSGVDPNRRDPTALRDAIDRAGVASFQITLVATDDVRRAADNLMESLHEFRGPFGGDELTPILQRLVDTKEGFDAAVRKELGISKPRRRLAIQADGPFALIGEALKKTWTVYRDAFSLVLPIRITRSDRPSDR